MRSSLASRLSGLYVTLLGVTVLLVILTSSIALVYVLRGFTFDIVMAKHEEARNLAEIYHDEGLSLQQSAPRIVDALNGFGLNVTVYDSKGKYLAGDKTLRPPLLDRVLSGRVPLPPPTAPNSRVSVLPIPPSAFASPGPFNFPSVHPSQRPLPFGLPGATGTVGGLVYHGINSRTRNYETYIVRSQPPRFDPFSLAAINGGYVAFAQSTPLLLISLVPYWRVVITIAIVAVVLSWLLARIVARQALEPINEVTSSLQALAAGDFTQRRFMMAGGERDEIAILTHAYNEAAAGVAAAMNERRTVEERMRQFVADAGHELRTPLTVIAGYIDVLRRGAIEEPKIARQILGTMAIEKEHMRGLIDRLMRLARLDAEEPPRVETIDVAELLRSQCEAARRIDEHRSIDYSVEGVTEIQGDRTELGEAIWNAVENALKYADEAPIHLSATRQFTSGGGNVVVIMIRDEGPGMTELERLHAFERFYRGDVRGEITGTGLGLAIAKRAVERAGGTIALDSAPNHGTTVTITLPEQG